MFRLEFIFLIIINHRCVYIKKGAGGCSMIPSMFSETTAGNVQLMLYFMLQVSHSVNVEMFAIRDF